MFDGRHLALAFAGFTGFIGLVEFTGLLSWFSHGPRPLCFQYSQPFIRRPLAIVLLPSSIPHHLHRPLFEFGNPVPEAGRFFEGQA